MTKVLLAACVTLVFAVSPTPLEAQTPTRPARRPKPTVRVVNTGADSIRVEFRSGRNLNCAQNWLVGVRMVGAAKSWTVRSDEPLCYRYQRNPVDASPVWSPWVRKVVARSAVASDSV